ncbi:N-formylglutamate amidohydrolase [Fulvivirga sedimenti]|uniref:N-formylglutamate amidohydrolase n=1 Tax=Fulvivirga sedimenti TaxID=2879465 RepID=A0A9X1HQY4_9BACT|nr:N-formylglutamate amidohydrolase [Fulvivirga sedimenti]MCA6075158.1 N-formylglutamate amidohydrolase [Fulvivirga sedimenti]MCA6076335.1 N-formylglutamate amidohydrolase [Fulvivirga sedimenti]MCA6077463.1 N-formylglutamate amidohydrolase [Fulvivirga sedimenti]
MEVFRITAPRAKEVPVIVSSPHSGIRFPDSISIKAEFAGNPDDTDWFIDQLYDFVPDMGATLISAVYNRWVIDLNRDPANKPLYSDGRVITGLVPLTTFNGAALYDLNPGEKEIQIRIDQYFRPYHDKLSELISEKVKKFGKVILFDAHSIRKNVPGIRPEPFPDLILGDDEGRSASDSVITAAMKALTDSPFQVAHNEPFKGGYITRNYGDPEKNIHALQLEMAKLNYLDDSERLYDHARAGQIRKVLENLFTNLIHEVSI